MYSPFYTAEQKRLYPHRDISIQTQKEAEEFFKSLISKKVETREGLSKKTLGTLKHAYLPNCDHWTILAALSNVK